MKKTYSFIAFGVLFSIILPTGYTFAETSSTTRLERIETRQENRIQKLEDREERIEENKARIASTTETRINKANERAGEIAKKRSEMITDRYSNAISQLEKTAGKISTHINKLQAKGLDMTTAKASLALAETKIATAKTALTTLQTYIDGQQVTAKNRVSVMKSIRSQAESTLKTNIKDAHTNLVNVLNSLKGQLGKKENKVATSTASSSNQ